MLTSIRSKVAKKAALACSNVLPNLVAKQLNNPFFLVNCGRSGTSFLFSLLALHKDIAAYPEEANELGHPKAYPWHL